MHYADGLFVIFSLINAAISHPTQYELPKAETECILTVWLMSQHTHLNTSKHEKRLVWCMEWVKYTCTLYIPTHSIINTCISNKCAHEPYNFLTLSPRLWNNMWFRRANHFM